MCHERGRLPGPFVNASKASEMEHVRLAALGGGWQLPARELIVLWASSCRWCVQGREPELAAGCGRTGLPLKLPPSAHVEVELVFAMPLFGVRQDWFVMAIGLSAELIGTVLSLFWGGEVHQAPLKIRVGLSV